MKRKVIIDVSNNCKEKLVGCITSALNKAELNFISKGQRYNNGLGLDNLNFIFEELHKHESDDFIVGQQKRGCFSFILAYDRLSKTLITLSSKANIKKLKNRVNVSKLHYIDALLPFNKDFEGDYIQGSFFNTIEEGPSYDARKELSEKLITVIREESIDKYIIGEYEINHRKFSLDNLNFVLYSNHFVKLASISLFEYIQSDYHDKTNPIINAPDEREKVQNLEERKLNIKLKKV